MFFCVKGDIIPISIGSTKVGVTKNRDKITAMKTFVALYDRVLDKERSFA